MNSQEKAHAVISSEGINRGNSVLVDDEIDLLQLLGRLWERKLAIVGTVALFAIASVVYALTAQPVFRAQALVQIEAKEGVPGLNELTEMFTTESEAVTEIELMRSRMVIGETVDRLQLDVIVEPVRFPVFGGVFARQFSSVDGSPAGHAAGGFAWGGEYLEFSEFSVPHDFIGETFDLEVLGEDRYSLAINGNPVLDGVVGQKAEAGDVSVQVKTMSAFPGVRFEVTRIDRLKAITELSEQLSVSEKGRQSGILTIHLDGENPALVNEILDTIVTTYVRKNVDRNAAEVTNSLEFLEGQLPQVRMQLEAAEAELNAYQVSAESVNILAETEVLLDQMVTLEEQISELQLRQVEVTRLFRPDHPNYVALVGQLDELEARKAEFQDQIKSLPETQQRLLQLTRDVEVNTQIYTQLLNNLQELDILRAGTIGNVRVVDEALVNTYKPVAPRKYLIVTVTTMLGGVTAVIFVLIQAALRRTIENPEEIERLGLPVYAAVPFSAEQIALEKGGGGDNDQLKLLSVTKPSDVSIEAIRSLRTSIHFAMVEASNNIIMITGPNPVVGKSFVSSNLGVTMALAGQKVLIIDADMRKGYLHRLFSLEKEGGLSDYLSHQIEKADLVNQTQIEGLSVITHGNVPPNPSELLMSRQFEELLDSLKDEYDLIIIDTPPVLAVTDAVIVGKYVGTTMLVTRFQQNTLEEVEISMRRLEQNGIETRGCIFNAIRQTGRYGYGYGYGNGYYTYEYKQT